MSGAWNAQAATAIPALLVACLLAACGTAPAPASDATAGDAQAAASLPARAPAGMPATFGLGRRATEADIRPWDIDVNPTGATLPKGRGTYAAGQALFAAQCASCHGAKGEGMHPAYPRLVGAEPRDFSFADDPAKARTIGNYWPYATTLFDYLNRAMPLTAPGSLTPDQVYALVAYLLAENEVIGRDAVMDATTLPAVKMPGRDHFVPDDRTGGPAFR
ncbi:MAG TPA: cytochrome c [Gemmatimonadales bacterium]|nr:cytochrome c [Gemmatimonadales bacterium]